MKSLRMTMLCALLSLTLNVWAEDPPSKPAAKPAAAAKATNKADTADTKAAPAKATAHANDQLTLDATTVTGNRELPKVMYIVPWKKADLSTLPGQPFNTLVDETLAPVDREVLRRQVAYYDVVSDKDHAGVKSATDAAATSAADKK